MKSILRQLSTPVIAAVLAMLVGGIVAAAIGYNPLQVYGSLLSGAFGNAYNLGNTLAIATPLILIGLGIAVAFRAGLFNIGAEGQYWVAVMCAAWTGYHFTTLPGWLHIILCLLVAMVAGGLWAGIIPGLAKTYRGAHEVITTMMMSYIGILLCKYMIEEGPMRKPGSMPESEAVAQNTWLPVLSPSSPQLTIGLFIAIAAVIVVWFILFHTTIGFQLRTVGLNPRAARYAGIRVTWYTILALGLSGMLAGLAGGVQLLAMDHRLAEGFNTGYGYTGIVVSLLARNNPFGVIVSAIFFAALSTGGQNMQQVTNIPASLTDVLTGLIIFFVAAERLLPQVIQWYRRRTSRVRTSTAGEGPKSA
ncbi:ABC transporter permease [Alicyclobacillus contaminans]|uniref:ABC transporter permease n=1 Tax=Alicyclobacillus contaminans TaxID=392016 RepID=UPI0003FF28F4|nr:ABC transporter permease [Alicyclobacillus contaminans]GMA49250.1 ABC transporter permease [Alicyclobacillus contaminans]